VDELQVSYGAFVDDFDDGVFPDGGEGEPMLYTVPCGVVTDADESGGLLTLAGPDPVCGVPNLVAENVAGFFAAAGDLEVTGTFVGQVPSLDHAYGVIVNDLTGADFATLQVARAPVPQGSDSVVVVLVDETFIGLPVALAILGDAASYVPPAGIEVRLSVELAPGGGELLPRGAYRECPELPCDAAIPFTPLADFLGGGGMASGEFHAPGFLAVDIGGDVVPAPFAFELDSFRVQYGAVVDDFEDGVQGEPIPYVQVDGASDERAGALVLSDPEPGFGSAIVALDASSPTEVLGAARFRFQLPSACGNYGLSVVDSPVQDVVSLNVVRGVLPGAGDDALAVIAQSEAESASQFAPIFAQALISEHPESDPRATHSTLRAPRPLPAVCKGGLLGCRVRRPRARRGCGSRAAGLRDHRGRLRAAARRWAPALRRAAERVDRGGSGAGSWLPRHTRLPGRGGPRACEEAFPLAGCGLRDGAIGHLAEQFA
jgi:hypothetical protein